MCPLRDRLHEPKFAAAAYPTEPPIQQPRGMILLVAENQDVRRSMRIALSAAGFDVGESRSEQEAALRMKLVDLDLVLIDLERDDLWLIELVSSIRDIQSRIPVFVQCTNGGEGEEIHAFDAGVNDFIVKPINGRVLASRISSAIRLYRCPEVLPQGVVAARELVLDPVRHMVRKRGTPIHLTVQEFKALKFLMENPGQLILHATFMHFLWGASSDQARRRLRVLINSLRKKLERNPRRPKYLLTEVNLGYRFEGGVSGPVHSVTPTLWN
jgi:two-component system, OmpR family, KDP operon response regulator KdpE